MTVIQTIPEHFSGNRLDKALASIFPDHSRTTIQTWLAEGRVLLNETVPSQRHIVTQGDVVSIDIPEPVEHNWGAEDIPIEIVFEDDNILVVNKSAGMVVHPGAGNSSGTLLNALLQHSPSIGDMPRAGIVHRLDKNTSGLLVIAKNEKIRLNLIQQFKSRTAKRQYLAVVEGRLISGGTIDVPVGRHPRNRKKMTAGVGKPAVSHFRIVSRFRLHTLVRVALDTGRTHQIRVHFRHAGFPLVGDPDYGSRPKIPPDATDELVSVLTGFRRQALHAESLTILYPENNDTVGWHQGLPQDMRNLIVALKADTVEFAADSSFG